MEKSEYRKLERISYSGLKHLARSPAHYRHWFDAPEETTPAKLLGSLVHSIVLEPDQTEHRYCVALEVDKKSKANKAAWAEFEAENAGKIVVTQKQYDDARFMRDAILAHPQAQIALSNGRSEEIALWIDSDTGAECKLRTDWVNRGYGGAIIDIKTTTDASETAFAKDCFNMGYYMQSAFYLDGYNAANGTDYKDFIFVAVEKTPPYAVAVWALDYDAIALGRFAYKPLLEKYAECRKTGVWHGYENKIKSLTLPRWAFK